MTNDSERKRGVTKKTASRHSATTKKERERKNEREGARRTNTHKKKKTPNIHFTMIERSERKHISTKNTRKRRRMESVECRSFVSIVAVVHLAYAHVGMSTTSGQARRRQTPLRISSLEKRGKGGKKRERELPCTLTPAPPLTHAHLLLTSALRDRN